MKLSVTESGFALYKEADIIGQCDVTPTPKGADITALSVLSQWRRKGYGSYLLKEILRRFGGYDREAATVFTAPLPADEGEGLFWQKFGFAPEDGRLVRRTILQPIFPTRSSASTPPAATAATRRSSAALPARKAGCWASTSSPRPSLPPAPGSKSRASRQSLSATATRTSYSMSGPARRTS